MLYMGNTASRVAVVVVFLVRAQVRVRRGTKLYYYTGNTKVPITSNSQRLMKYKWHREK